MIGYLRLLGADARHYIDCISESGKTIEDQLLCIPNKIDQEIKQYIDYILQNMAVSKGKKPWQPSFDLLIFLYNLKCALAPNADIRLAENDPLEIAHQYDVMREAYLNGDRTSTFEIMCNPNG